MQNQALNTSSYNEVGPVKAGGMDARGKKYNRGYYNNYE